MLGGDKGDVRVSTLLGGTTTLGVNSLDVADDLLVAGTDNEALLLLNHLPVY